MERNKKIGILTTYFASNFGAMLQPFALKSYLESLGYDVEMIRYKQTAIYKFCNPWRPYVFTCGNFRILFGYLRMLPGLIRRDRVFKKFMWKHINSEKGFADIIADDKDFYFIGSDQIWNPKNTQGFDDIYFGNFKCKTGAIKASYAASGEDIDYGDTKTVEYLKTNIKNFDFVSVREKFLEHQLKNITGRTDIVTVLDPTMLVDSSVYNKLEQTNPCPDYKFYFFYAIRDCECFLDKIYEDAQNNGCKLVVVSEMPNKVYRQYAKLHKECIYLPYAGEEIFLGGMKHAEYVFTPSFHGTVFAILNHKRFHTLQLHDSKMTRPTHLLSILGLTDRLLAIDDDIKVELIDYDYVDRLLNSERDKSRQFISSVLNK